MSKEVSLKQVRKGYQATVKEARKVSLGVDIHPAVLALQIVRKAVK